MVKKRSHIVWIPAELLKLNIERHGARWKWELWDHYYTVASGQCRTKALAWKLGRVYRRAYRKLCR